ncbi:MAG: MBL fold metallo-hydrolase [Geminicoccaceae bacterium]|nr:MBL fold metallo-hydrolase [Geminicoccaceae bacterium]
MKPLRPPLRYLHDQPENGVPVEVAPGLLWVRLPLPFALDHVNVWLVDEGDGWTVIDAGYADGESRAIWETLLGGILSGRPVTRVVATHYHPDHIGLAGWLCTRTGAALWTSRTEWLTARMLTLDTTASFAEIGAAHDRSAGMSEEWVLQRETRGNLYRRGVTLASPSYTRVAADDVLTLAGGDWRVIVGEGHAPEMLTLHCPERNLLIAADQILPRISPIIGVWPMNPDADPLADYLTSLERYRYIDDGCCVLPSHDGPFVGLQPRIDQLIAHHRQRLDMCRELCRRPRTVAEVMQHLFRRDVDLHQVGFAQGETLSHLNHLICRGELERTVGPDGVWHFVRID